MNSAQRLPVVYVRLSLPFYLSSSQDLLHCTLSINSLCLHTLPTSKLYQQNRFFFVGPWSRHSCLQGQAFVRWMRDFFECVIVIVMQPGVSSASWDVVAKTDISHLLCCTPVISMILVTRVKKWSCTPLTPWLHGVMQKLQISAARCLSAKIFGSTFRTQFMITCQEASGVGEPILGQNCFEGSRTRHHSKCTLVAIGLVFFVEQVDPDVGCAESIFCPSMCFTTNIRIIFHSEANGEWITQGLHSRLSEPLRVDVATFGIQDLDFGVCHARTLRNEQGCSGT